MRLDLRNANRFRFPKLSYINMRKKFPNMGPNVFTKWFNFKRAWSGRLWLFEFKHHTIELDFRKSWLDDMAFPNTTKADRDAVNDAVKMKGTRE